MPPATMTTSRAAASVDRPRVAERAADAEDVARLRRADRLAHRADGAHRVHERAAGGRRDIEIGTSPTPNAYSIVNWPGANVERARRRPARARASRCRASRASAARPGTARRHRPEGARVTQLCRHAIHVEQPLPRPLQALDHDLREARHQVVAELRVGLALLAQAGAVEARRAHEREGARVEVPAVGREEPRPADDLAGVDRLDRDGAAGRDERLERDAAVPQDVEGVRLVAVAEQQLALAKLDVAPAAGDQLELRPASGPRTAAPRAASAQSFCIDHLLRLRGSRSAPRSRRSRPGTRRCSARSRRSRSCRTGRTRCRTCGSATGGSASGRTAGCCRRGCRNGRPRSRSPRARPLRVVAGQVGDVLDARAEARRADQRAVAAGEAARGDVVPARRSRGSARAGRGCRWRRRSGPSARSRGRRRGRGLEVGWLGVAARQLAQHLGAALGADLDEEAVRRRRGSRSARGRSPRPPSGRFPSTRRSTCRPARSS